MQRLLYVGLLSLSIFLSIHCQTTYALDLFKLKDKVNVGKEAVKAVRPMSEEEEYYVGRAVAARLLSIYPLLDNKKLTEYVNSVGQLLVMNSDRPFTYGGYHFALLNSDEINAFACPGGTILITKGMVQAVRSEDELAAVLAHEIAHVSHRDGVNAISKSRWTQVVTLVGTNTAKKDSPQVLSQLVGLFEGAIDDVFKTLVVNGYGQSQEYQADEAAISYLSKAGYNPSALKDFLSRLVSQGAASGGGILKTHPATVDRVKNVTKKMPSMKVDASQIQLRNQRFQAALK
jgi:predicted Zn-dependent protease